MKFCLLCFWAGISVATLRYLLIEFMEFDNQLGLLTAVALTCLAYQIAEISKDE